MISSVIHTDLGRLSECMLCSVMNSDKEFRAKLLYARQLNNSSYYGFEVRHATAHIPILVFLDAASEWVVHSTQYGKYHHVKRNRQPVDLT